MPSTTSSIAFPFQPRWVYGACRWAMWVRGSVEPPASPFTKGPQPWGTCSKSSWTTVPAGRFGAGDFTIRTLSKRTRAEPAAARRARVTGPPPDGTVKYVVIRWKRVSCLRSAATWLPAVEVSVRFAAVTPSTVRTSRVAVRRSPALAPTSTCTDAA